jgi:hypothetical protein
MEKITAEQLLNLEYGDTIYLVNKSFAYSFRYVGRMPSSQRYLIFSSGETLKHIYVNKDGTFRGNWYIGEWTDEFCIKLRIEELEAELKTLKEELKR